MPSLGILFVLGAWIVGLLMYVLASNPKVAWLGFATFCATSLVGYAAILPAGGHF